MKISYDKQADAIYIAFKKGVFGSNKKIDDATVIDMDKEGKLLGIEFLSASKRIPPQEIADVKVRMAVEA